MAWLSVTGTGGGAKARFAAAGLNGPWKNLAGDLVAQSLDDLTTCDSNGCLSHAIQYDENADANSTDVWTGTLPDGNKASAYTCDNWQSGDDSSLAGYGTSVALDPNWTTHGFPGLVVRPCDFQKALYCFQK